VSKKIKLKNSRVKRLTASITLVEMQCGFVKIEHALPKVCYLRPDFVTVFNECLGTVKNDVLDIQERKRINDNKEKDSVTILFKCEVKSNRIEVCQNFEPLLHIKKPTVFQACKNLLFYAFEHTLQRLEETNKYENHHVERS